MPREFMCHWGNCESTDTVISVTIRRSEIPRFCCEEHAAAYLIRCARLLHPNGSPGDEALGAIEKAIAISLPPVRRRLFI
ncbi:hypothetical protein [Bradyrhizobium erythrophlei]|uniref:Uncharacterized protein n=1 Tax=Bradyrhizobium erythrophlei TaxID=1437360 RepID=A0A1M5NEP2_9BRAD|nr:hypothetical protein [Bradyrhizobium erythrophlei]SHG87935.1 hypothetical protein SAMN05443248_2963 [Bradyrhizobium erythrophlei]